MAGNFAEFHELFGPFDENFAQDLAEKITIPKQKGVSMDLADPSTMVYLPPGLPVEELMKIEAD